MSLLSDDRKVLLVVPDEEDREELSAAVQKHLSKVLVFGARDGAEAMSKINNAPPDLVFVKDPLPKRTVKDFVQWILDEKKDLKIGIIIISKIPDEELFVDEVVLGKVHFIEDFKKDIQLSKVMARALNYVSQGEEAEFKLLFLAPGEQLIKEGEKGDFVYILRNGKMKASILREGHHKFLGNIQKGEFVGEMSYINGEERSADVFAETDCELIQISSQRLDHVLFKKPAWAKALMQTLSKRLKRSNDQK